MRSASWFQITAAVAVLGLPLIGHSSAHQSVELPPPAEVESNADLRPRFVANAERRYELQLHSRQVMTAFDSEQVTASRMTARVTIRTLELEASKQSGHHLQVRFDYLSLVFEGGHLPGRFDPLDDESEHADSIYSQVCKPMLHEPFHVTLDQSGRIEAFEDLSDRAPDGFAKAIFFDLFDDAALRSLLQPVFQIHPDPTSSLDIGESWATNLKPIHAIGISPADLTSTLKAINRSGVAGIGMSGDASATPPSEIAVLPNLKTKESTASGSAEWNAAVGALMSLETNSRSLFESNAQGITIRVLVQDLRRIRLIDP